MNYEKKIQEDKKIVADRGGISWHKAEFERLNLAPATASAAATELANEFISNPANSEKYEVQFRGQYRKVHAFFLNQEMQKYDWRFFEKPSGAYEAMCMEDLPNRTPEDNALRLKYGTLVTWHWRAHGYAGTRKITDEFFADKDHQFASGYSYSHKQLG